MKNYAAFDLGAESGRVMLGTLSGGRLKLREIHRFANGPVIVQGTRRWDVLRIFSELREGLLQAARKCSRIESVSTDSWGVDYVLLSAHDPMAGVPYHYRDDRCDPAFRKALRKIDPAVIYGETGIQFMSINTLFQLYADLLGRPETLRNARQFLMVADYINYLFCGVRRQEESLASTSQIYNPATQRWSLRLMKGLGLPAAILPRLIRSGTALGRIVPDLSLAAPSLRRTRVVAGLSHDTAAAVSAVPAEEEHWAYLSSGTWSLLGMELPGPVITDRSRKLNFTNEQGIGRTTRFLKNITGLFMVQECRKQWAAEGRDLDYAALTRLAGSAKPFRALLDPSDPRFARPGNMPETIRRYCRETGQSAPRTPGETVRCVLESLALNYRRVLEGMIEVTGRRVDVIHIVGGGSRNRLLDQFAASAMGRRVTAGPVEATAAGNILIQAMALGHVRSLAESRAIVRRSFPVETFEPRDAGGWEKAYQRFLGLL